MKTPLTVVPRLEESMKGALRKKRNSDLVITLVYTLEKKENYNFGKNGEKFRG